MTAGGSTSGICFNTKITVWVDPECNTQCGCDVCECLPFFVTLLRNIKLITADFLPSHTVNQLCNALKKALVIYWCGSFMVQTCLMDMECKKLVDVMDKVIVNSTAAREHVGDIDHTIHTVKKRGRSMASELLYKCCMPNQIIMHLIKFVTMWINTLPSANRVTTTISSREIVTWHKMDF